MGECAGRERERPSVHEGELYQGSHGSSGPVRGYPGTVEQGGSVSCGPQGDRSKKLVAVLLYTLEQGPVEKTIIAQCEREKRPLPSKIANAPELLLGLDFVYTAFMELSTCRSVGMGEGPIPWTAIRDYTEYAQIDDFEQLEDFFYLIREMDSAYLDFRKKELERKK